MADVTSGLLTSEEAAEIVGVSIATVLRAHRVGSLVSSGTSGQGDPLFSREAVELYQRRRTELFRGAVRSGVPTPTTRSEPTAEDQAETAASGAEPEAVSASEPTDPEVGETAPHEEPTPELAVHEPEQHQEPETELVVHEPQQQGSEAELAVHEPGPTQEPEAQPPVHEPWAPQEPMPELAVQADPEPERQWVPVQSPVPEPESVGHHEAFPALETWRGPQAPPSTPAEIGRQEWIDDWSATLDWLDSLASALVQDSPDQPD